MGFYQFRREQCLPVSQEELWDFISSPANLKDITPPKMNFEIVGEAPEGMYPGLIIAYRVSVLPLCRVTWVTEITQVEEGRYFIDEQRVGPYKMWHHQHILSPIAADTKNSGTKMEDIISYQPPFGPLGNVANALHLARTLQHIFNYRFQALEERFGVYPPL